jgi:hypothetical protein
MSSLANLHLQSNTKIKINFNGGNLSSDAGLLHLHEFAEKLGLQQLLKSSFKTTNTANRKHLGGEIATALLFIVMLEKARLVSQFTVSRFGARLDEETMRQLHPIACALRKRIYCVCRKPHARRGVQKSL